MQTFLPYPSFSRSARALDTKRLGKQRVETLQIMSSLMTGSGWVNHPATRMWEGFEWALLHYQQAVFYEWVEIRGFQDTCFAKTQRLYFEHGPRQDFNRLPPWHGDKMFHLSHQSNLIRKDPDYYGPQFLGTPDNLPYIWPTD